PLVLDAQNRLYLHRLYEHERALADALVHRLEGPAMQPMQPAVQLLRGRFAHAAERPDWQQVACASALLGRLTVLSGGPGTGKTTTVVSLLAILLAQEPDLRIALCAPTGKAAARMVQSIAGRAADLPEDLRTRLPSEALTVHRLLGFMPREGRFRHHAGAPLGCDVLIVDEASMLDLALARRLVDALPLHARLILIGDKDQLASVEAGAVFSQLSAQRALADDQRRQIAALCELPVDALDEVPDAPADSLATRVCWLTRNFRFQAQPAIGRLAQTVRDGDAAGTLDVLEQADGTGLRWLDHALDMDAAAAEIDRGYADYWRLLETGQRDPAALFAALGRFRVLCAQREGPASVAQFNRLARHRLRQALGDAGLGAAETDRLPGEALMMRGNDYALALFNGDMAIVLPDAQGVLHGVFERGPQDWLWVPLARLPQLDPAFAMTVHKSQGSEFDAVLVALPQDITPLCTRELLYTGITRARAQVTLAASRTLIDHAVTHPTRRSGGLPDRLREAALLKARAAP
ncbi:MAG TPA: exodeoxyribonuclease V subunit alpha, partial [Burkholderiaceae bacterium]|nr:exodeoxyribonuclease V subunit alpha [Burkholderiaceae bacterium]